MFSKYVSIGDRVELQSVSRGGEDTGSTAGRVYTSVVQDILSEDSIEIRMPIEKSKLILLPVDGEFDMIFYGASGMYQCLARVTDRYKSNNVFLLQMELTTNLQRYQRREFYRLRCALEMHTRLLEESEIQAMESLEPYTLEKSLPLKQSVAVDISGGGLRFVGDYPYEPNSLIYCQYSLDMGEKKKDYSLMAKILVSIEVENKPGSYEHRAQYINIDTSEREEIIRFIFEEERKRRKREKGL